MNLVPVLRILFQPERRPAALPHGADYGVVIEYQSRPVGEWKQRAFTCTERMRLDELDERMELRLSALQRLHFLFNVQFWSHKLELFSLEVKRHRRRHKLVHSWMQVSGSL